MGIPKGMLMHRASPQSCQERRQHETNNKMENSISHVQLPHGRWQQSEMDMSVACIMASICMAKDI